MKVGESEKPKIYKSGTERNLGEKQTENEALNQEENFFLHVLSNVKQPKRRHSGHSKNA